MNKKLMRKKLMLLTDIHDMSKCVANCKKCEEIKNLAKTMEEQLKADKYFIVNRDGRVETFKTLLEIQNYLRCSHLSLKHAFDNGSEIKAWTIDQIF